MALGVPEHKLTGANPAYETLFGQDTGAERDLVQESSRYGAEGPCRVS